MKKILLLVLFFFFLLIPSRAAYDQPAINQDKIFINYGDLVKFSNSAKLEGLYGEKLKKQLNTPIIYQPSKTSTPFLSSNKLGSFFRVASWNIERGFFAWRIAEIFNYVDDLKTNPELQEQLDEFSKASVIILNEADIGIPRTSYENIPKKIANAFKMGYVFGTEFLEVDPYQLGVKKFTDTERVFLEQDALNQLDNIQKEKYSGLHGTAILTKYPILNARIIRLPDCYSWYFEEMKKLSAIELARRGAAKTIFSEKILTELRHGGRMALLVDLLLPNNQKITVVGTHLENRCLPECRVKQLSFLLEKIKGINNPVILGGDFNTTGTDASPVTIKKEVLKRVKDPEFIVGQAILSLTPITIVQDFAINTINKIRNFKDPTIKHIPVILPNKERKIFDLIKDFKFSDGVVFDVSGDSKNSFNGKSGFLGNSNERELKGFKPTFELERPFGVARYKLDWFFVKPYNGYAPYFGRTLEKLNRNYGKISDHDPIIVDIPIGTSPIP